MTFSFDAGVRDSLSNLAASLGTGRDKASHDAFTVFDLGRAQIEAMYRGDWLARKVVDIVPYDSVRAWRSWSGHRADVARFEAAERRLGLRKTVLRAMTLGRLYGGGAILIGDGETDIAKLARPLDPRLPKDGLLYLHALSRWQLGVSALDLNPLSPWCGEPKFYTLSSPGLPPLELHPSRVVRFLGSPLPDPSAVGTPWSDSVLQALYDAVHAAALSLAGATSLLHEAKVDVVTVPNLSEHLSSVETTAQLSARFAYAAAMKSMNNLLLLGDGESWSRQTVDFAGLPEMARTFLQVAAGAADIPVTRLLGQSPAGLSATGESDVRNYYDMIAARQELDLRPQLERLDRLICWSEDIDEGALSFAFRPLWQLDEPAKAALALAKAQATQVYAGLKLWPDAVVARLAEAQLVADGTYPNAAAVFAEQAGEVVTDSREVGAVPRATGEFWSGEDEPRDWHGRWTRIAGTAPRVQGVQVAHAGEDPFAGGDPNIDEHLRKILEEQERPLHIGPSLVPKEQPDGTIKPADPSGIFLVAPVGAPKAAPAAISGAPAKVVAPPAAPKMPEIAAPIPSIPAQKPAAPSTGAGSGPASVGAGPLPIEGEAELAKLAPFWKPAGPKTPEEKAAHPLMRAFRAAQDGDIRTLEACKAELPPEIARHLILGFIGPGPFAAEPIPIEPGQRITRAMKSSLLSDGSPPRCHICGTTTMDETGGRLSLDHQLPTALNILGWPQVLYRHCRLHYSSQGGRVQFLQKYMVQEGLVP